MFRVSLVVWEAPTSGFAEAFRQIRANLQFATAAHPGGLLVVSSAEPGEGKSTILANLAVALAQSGKRVVLVDADLRRPTLHRLLKVEQREPGLSNLLADMDVDFGDVIQRTGVEGVDIIASGPSPPNPAELLGSPRMGQTFDYLRGEYDSVLVDSPPVLAVADASILAAQVDGVLFVLDGSHTRSSSLQAAVDTIRKAEVNITGVIMNKLKRPGLGYGYRYPYYYYYYHSYYRYYYGGDEMPVNGAGKFYRGAFQRAKAVWTRVRRR